MTVALKKNRLQAREQVALAWHQRRQQQQQQQQSGQDSSSQRSTRPPASTASSRSTALTSTPSQQSQQPAAWFPFWSALFQKANSVQRCGGCTTTNHHHKSFTTKAHHPSSIPPSSNKQPPNVARRPSQQPPRSVDHHKGSNSSTTHTSSSSSSSPTTFPSMLALHQANALSRQIETLLLHHQGHSQRNLGESQPEQEPDDDPEPHQDPPTARTTATAPTAPSSKSSSSSSSSSSLLVSILSSQYNLEQAVYEMAQARTRAFWLVDLSTVVHRLVEWDQTWNATSSSSSTTHVPPVRLLYRVSANAHPILLRVLTCCCTTTTTTSSSTTTRSLRGTKQPQQQQPEQEPVVQLVTSNAWDLEQVQHFGASQRQQSTSSSCVTTVWDDSTWTGKPNAYLRKAWLGRPQSSSASSSQPPQAQPAISCLAVNGPHEVHRIWNALQRATQRRRQRPNQSSPNNNHHTPRAAGLSVCLRLPVGHPHQWLDTWISTVQALDRLAARHNKDDDDDESLFGIVAVSVEVSDLIIHSSNAPQKEEEHTSPVVDYTSTPSSTTPRPPYSLDSTSWKALMECLTWNHHQDHNNTNDTATTSSSSPQAIRVELTGSVELDPAMVEFVSVLQRQAACCSTTTTRPQPLISELAIDITGPLLTSAGALCTRVIGVRESSSDPTNHDDESSASASASASTTTPQTTEEPPATTRTTTRSKRRLHYYIDDGCYGSLYQEEGGKGAAHPLQPVPLITTPRSTTASNSDQDTRTNSTQDNDNHNNKDTFVSTVWGPTCDGLDRVCNDIWLPELQRDDWLVFPIHCSGGEGLGTAFNGFCPPDTAYCVLGYFRE